MRSVKKPLDIQIWPDARRVLLRGPVLVTAFSLDGPLMRFIFDLCGSDAIAVADIGNYLGGFAFCTKDGAESWRSELGISYEVSNAPR
jgi:hypothetical protein